ncbi:16S rRNA (cytosine(1402)-N(4))-methyltransferase [Candidatus Curtissbacteria bacterium RIFCSPLOWO2_01_FULL_41_18]|uniref:Ribosomal RNA small subunit methyltransferase H n=2 Tax=Candidatus Curtissiibacteriota TaxID=1752717 RepID=A0A1F5G1R0_9BACT|nr:MAG: 16S rRNA (cytosine(1402)-N(4))-methyltransferase [Candidatus Curtissbacteria bacterium RIFCSPHIGHO2_01_FULL_41_13]OGE03902.1 MAG: 16S rRNA (cytosine(1402)-N(4))-methyltransferase [Candidatus Curtissbacteria bacterium RIFCSPLOWO2_01_FULL_41_18]
MSQYHQSVLLQEAIKFLNVKPQHLYIDATIGGGGHTRQILRRGGKVLGIDSDPESIAHLNKKFKIENLKLKIGEDLILAQGNFNRIADIARSHGFSKVSGILFDLGVSSHQLETAQRGFSFQKEGPLDMRMDKNSNIRAFDLVNNLEKRRLNEIFEKYAGEKLSWSIASAICSARKIKPIETTDGLAHIIKEVYRRKHLRTKLHPATKAFQALRIVVNSELLNLEEALPQTVNLLEKQGRLVVISFHSLEDSIVKRFFKYEKRLKVLTKTPIGPGSGEILHNPRSRSARLRAAVKI